MTPYDESDYERLVMAEADAEERQRRQAGGSDNGDEIYELKNALRRAAQMRQRRRRVATFSRK